MAEDLRRFEKWATPLIEALSESERLKLSRAIGQKLRRSQARRIAAQRNPDGSPYEPRKAQPNTTARRRRGGIRRAMFTKIRQARFLRVMATSEGVALGFIGRVGRIARIHQDGLTDQVQPNGPKYKYPERELLGFSDDDIEMIRDTIIDYLDQVKNKAA